MPLSDYYPELQGWTPVPAKEPVRELVPSIPDPNTNPNPFMRTTMPLPLQYQQDTMKEYNRPGVSSFRIAPLAPTARAEVVAATQSTSKIVATQVVKTTASGGVTSVGLAMPKEFTVTGSPVTSSGTLTTAWASEPASFLLQAPGPGLTGYEGTGYGAAINPIGVSTPLSVSFTPTTSTSLAILTAEANAGIGLNGSTTGWTEVGTTQFWYKAISGNGTITAGFNSLGQQSTAIGAMSVFSGPAPAHVQDGQSSANPSAIALTHTAGDTIFVSARAATFNPASQPSIVISDTLGNAYQQIVNDFTTGPSGASTIGFQISVWVCTNCIGGSNTINVAFSGPLSGSPSTVVSEFGTLPVGPGIPFFAPLNSASIPPINLASTGNGGVGGTLPVVRGGTGTTTATGTAGSVVLSNSPTLTTPAISGNATMTGKFTTYDNLSTTGNFGLATNIAVVDKTAQSAAISTTTIITPSTAGQYRLSWNAKVTTAATTSSTLGALTITYTDPDGVVQTITASAQNSAGTIETTDTGNTTTTVMLGHPLLLNIKASTAIQYAFAYTSSGATAMQYNLHIVVEGL